MQKLVIDCSASPKAAPPTYVDLTPEEVEQRGKDTQAGKAAAWDALRAQRCALLTACDWTQLLNAPLSPKTVEEWRKYREALRDLPANTKDPATAVWPTPPT